MKVLLAIIILLNLPTPAQSPNSTDELITSNIWGLHGIVKVNHSLQTEEREELGDSDVRLKFTSDGTLVELEENIKRKYKWRTESDSIINITKTPVEKKEHFNSFLMLEQVKDIYRIDNYNLILQTDLKGEISYRFLYVKDYRDFE